MLFVKQTIFVMYLLQMCSFQCITFNNVNLPLIDDTVVCMMHAYTFLNVHRLFILQPDLYFAFDLTKWTLPYNDMDCKAVSSINYNRFFLILYLHFQANTIIYTIKIYYFLYHFKYLTKWLLFQKTCYIPLQLFCC